MAVGVCNSSCIRSSLRSISSRRRRISERLSSEVMALTGMKRPRPVGWGLAEPGPQLAERIKLSLFTLRWWEKVLVLCFFHITFGLISLSRSDPSWDLFVHAKDLFD